MTKEVEVRAMQVSVSGPVDSKGIERRLSCLICLANELIRADRFDEALWAIRATQRVCEQNFPLERRAT